MAHDPYITFTYQETPFSNKTITVAKDQVASVVDVSLMQHTQTGQVMTAGAVIKMKDGSKYSVYNTRAEIEEILYAAD